MTITEAITEAKKRGDWNQYNVIKEAPNTVVVEFETAEGCISEYEFNLYEKNKEQELKALWESIYIEMDSTKNGVTYIEIKE